MAYWTTIWGQSDEERSEILWPYLKGLIKARGWYADKLAIEGTNFSPKLISEVKDLPYLKICFLGFSQIDVKEKVENIRNFKSLENDWTNDMSDEALLELTNDLKVISIDFKNECEKYGIKYFDTSHNFGQVIKEAAEFLISDTVNNEILMCS